MRELLFLAHRIPYPPDRGDKIRSWHMLRHLSEHSRVHIACFADDENDARHEKALRARLGDRLGEMHVEVRRRGKIRAGVAALGTRRPVSLELFDGRGLRDFVARRISEGVDTVFAFSSQMAQFVPAGMSTRFVMDMGDVDSAKFEQYAKDGPPLLRWINRREGRLLAHFERDIAARADVTLFVSEAEAELFRTRTGLNRVQAVSNGIDLDHFDRYADFPWLGAEQRADPILLFTGQMDYPPNVDAVSWFARKVMPRLPVGRLVIAGRNPAPPVQALASHRIHVTGAVDDMRSWLAAASVVVAPLRIARGIQNKVLEAMAMARPVVASPEAFEGIEAHAGRDLIVAAGAGPMAEAVRQLLDHREDAEALGARARRCVERRYDWAHRLRDLEDIVFPTAERAAA